MNRNIATEKIINLTNQIKRENRSFEERKKKKEEKPYTSKFEKELR